MLRPRLNLREAHEGLRKPRLVEEQPAQEILDRMRPNVSEYLTEGEVPKSLHARQPGAPLKRKIMGDLGLEKHSDLRMPGQQPQRNRERWGLR